MSPRVYIQRHDGGSRVALEPGTTTLGRSADCDLVISDPTVSRLHAELEWDGVRLLLQHRSTINPTRVNGALVEDARELANGDRIQLAEGAVLEVVLEPDAQSVAPEPSPPPEPPPSPKPREEPIAAKPREKPVAAAHPPPAARSAATGERVEVAIVGAGPAGIAAASQAARRGISHVLLERTRLANTIVRYQKGKLVMAEPPVLPLQPELRVRFEAASREEVLARWEEDFGASGARHRCGPAFEVLAIEGEKGAFRLTLREGAITAANVVLSIGVQGNPRTFGVPGSELPFVTYQLDDPAEHEGKRIVVVGAGDAAIENALALAKHGARVAVVNRGEDFPKAKPPNRALVESAIKAGEITHYPNTTVARFEQDAIFLKTADGEERVDVDLVIGRLGALPPRSFLETCGIALPSSDPRSVPDVSETYQSNVPGLYVIGALAGYPLIKNCMNQGFEVIEHITGNPVAPADEPVLREKFADIPGSVDEILAQIRRTIPIFSQLTAVQLREFIFDSEIRRLKSREPIFERNDFTNTFFAILAGRVRISHPADEGATRIGASKNIEYDESFLEAGEFFGEAGLISGRRRDATATAASDCILIEASRLATNKLIRSVASVRDEIDRCFADRALARLAPALSAEERASFVLEATVRVFAKGEHLFREGDEPDGLHLVRRGTVAISQKIEERDAVVQYVQAGNYVGETAFLAPGRRRSVSVYALLPTETLFLPAAGIRRLIERAPDLARKGKKREVDEAIRGQRTLGGTLFFLAEKGGAEATDLLLIDEALCIRCDNCEKACSDTHDGISRLKRESGPTHQTRTGAQLHLPTACQHCENPKCMDDCPPDAIRRDPNGEVFILDNCIGCGNCVTNCPYGVIQLATVEKYRPRGILWRLLFGEKAPRSPRTEHDGEAAHSEVAVKCDLCRDLPLPWDGGTPAACVSACPTGAIVRVNPRTFVDELLAR
jgi:thioredoxin reductase/Fe-S-cluster-containing dehydrogenase component/CRP-like cAMP-binding protein